MNNFAPPSQTMSFKPAAGIVWAVEACGTLVIDEWGGRCLELDYPRAAIWDWLTQGRTVEQVAALTKHVADGSEDAAWSAMHDAVSTWSAEGWIKPADY